MLRNLSRLSCPLRAGDGQGPAIRRHRDCRDFLDDTFTSNTSIARSITVSSQAQFDAAVADAGPGDTITVTNGSYRLPDIRVSGTSGKPITIRAALPANKGGKAQISDVAKIVASNIVLDGFLFRSTSRNFEVIYVFKAENVTFRNNVIRQRGVDYGIRVHRSGNVVVEVNLFDGQFNHAVSAKERVRGMSIRGNSFIDCGLTCIESGQSPDGTLDIEQTSTSIEIINNSFEGKDTKGLLGNRGIAIKIRNADRTLVRSIVFPVNGPIPCRRASAAWARRTSRNWAISAVTIPARSGSKRTTSERRDCSISQAAGGQATRSI
ncbi:MAG: right-handed parallel beta-helix repeat-containing protein [Geminicoccaceae bacterium]